VNKSPFNFKVLLNGALATFTVITSSAQQKVFVESGTAQTAKLPEASAKPKAIPNPQLTTSSTNQVGSFPVPNDANSVNRLFSGHIPDAISNGKFNLNVRLRVEFADQDGTPVITKHSYAPTIRTRFGYTTAPLYGFQAMIEAVNVSAIGSDQNYNASGSNNQGSRPAVGDPPLTRLDQAWIGYNYTNYFRAKVGEQRIVLDNHRFIGDVGWRQNIQTFDAVTASSEPVKDLEFYYAYLWQVHRPFGDVDNLPPGNTDFESRSHLFNISYSGWEYGQFTGYTYLLDLHNVAGDGNSSASYGGFFSGAAPIDERMGVDYRAEFAWQTDYADSPLRYDAVYINVEAGFTLKPVSIGAGWENLGSGKNTGPSGGRASFRTPLATLHAFNGWADVFVTTPANGLHDLYGYGQIVLPANVPLRFIYHKYDADSGSGDYGQEFDLVASKKFGKYWSALLKYAYYEGEDVPLPSLAQAGVDIQKAWAQVEFNY